ncbi:glycerophosphodiester phosphodiesterase family protein [Leifsonia sp. Root112D2]|uniref:glycerophosphodiester phosphodiesterase family protein n=1 Tax=Leifsonia sp. Root112D2 TaxID=1736426 RepID=UPI00070223C9|nr:glycerophosphodiester phosphodiesterase family protein [Leifsonia sp. Root112D2]KQV07234.1 glycerophosphodiester phosphodiesterase [Leifsonia sp. Root112D2]
MGSHPSPVVIGHRGASGYRPEHTAAAYELAFALGADAVEPDIVATRDGVLVIRHENEISTTTDVADHPEFADRRATKTVDGVELTGWFTEDFTWAELSGLRATERLGPLRQASSTFGGLYPILRLADLFEIADAASALADRPIGIVAEIKHPSYFAGIGLPLDELFAAEVKESGWDQDMLTVECFEKTVLSQVHARGIHSERVYLVEASGAPYDRVASAGSAAVEYAHDVTERGLYELASAPPVERVNGVSVNTSMLFETDATGAAIGVTGLVDDAHSAGLGVFCWTLRAENRFLAPNFRRGERDADYGDWRSQFGLLLSSGVDGVFADQPDLAVAVRDGR